MVLLAVKVSHLPVNKKGHLKATNCLCMMFAVQQTQHLGATMNHMINRSSSKQERRSARFY